MADLTPLAQRVLERLDGIVDGDGDVDLGGRFGYLKPDKFERIVAVTQSLVAAQSFADALPEPSQAPHFASSGSPPIVTLASLSRRIDELDAEVQRLETVKLDIEPGVR